MHKQLGFCERCGAKLASDKIWWLELDQRTGTYTDQEVPAEFSQGCFAFGKDCAKIMLAEHDAAEKRFKTQGEQQMKNEFVKSLRELLHNLSFSENRNDYLTEDKIAYYRGMIVAAVNLTMSYADCDWNNAMRLVFASVPFDGEELFFQCLPFAWKDWKPQGFSPAICEELDDV